MQASLAGENSQPAMILDAQLETAMHPEML